MGPAQGFRRYGGAEAQAPAGGPAAALTARESRSAALRTRLGRPSAPSRVLLAVGGALNAAFLHDRSPSKFLRQAAPHPQLELKLKLGSLGWLCLDRRRLADAADGFREGQALPGGAAHIKAWGECLGGQSFLKAPSAGLWPVRPSAELPLPVLVLPTASHTRLVIECRRTRLRRSPRWCAAQTSGWRDRGRAAQVAMSLGRLWCPEPHSAPSLHHHQ